MGITKPLAALAAVMVLSLAGCSKDKSTEANQTKTDPANDKVSAGAEATPPSDPVSAKSADAAAAQVKKPVVPKDDDKTISDTEKKPTDDNDKPDDADEPPVRKATKCEDLKKSVNRAIAAIDRRCASDDDCDEDGFGCPFGCMLAIRKGANVSHAERKAARYHEQCGRCKYRCKAGGQTKCVTKRCTRVYPDAKKDPIDIIIKKGSEPDGQRN